MQWCVKLRRVSSIRLLDDQSIRSNRQVYNLGNGNQQPVQCYQLCYHERIAGWTVAVAPWARRLEQGSHLTHNRRQHTDNVPSSMISPSLSGCSPVISYMDHGPWVHFSQQLVYHSYQGPRLKMTLIVYKQYAVWETLKNFEDLDILLRKQSVGHPHAVFAWTEDMFICIRHWEHPWYTETWDDRSGFRVCLSSEARSSNMCVQLTVVKTNCSQTIAWRAIAFVQSTKQARYIDHSASSVPGSCTGKDKKTRGRVDDI